MGNQSTLSTSPRHILSWPVRPVNFTNNKRNLTNNNNEKNIDTEINNSEKKITSSQSPQRPSIIQRAAAKLFYGQKSSQDKIVSSPAPTVAAAEGPEKFKVPVEQEKTSSMHPHETPDSDAAADAADAAAQAKLPKTTSTWFEGSVDTPLNREPSPDVLIQTFISDKDVYDRNHGPIPHINADSHILRVDGSVSNFLTLSIPYLRSLPQYTVIAALQCAGNRRHTMRTKEKEVWGIDWRNGAVMNASWTGVLLSDILKLADPTLTTDEESHVAFSCYQTATQDDGYYGGSIPLKRAVDRDMEVLLALQMNGKELTPERGFPIRVIVPGVAGARAVKWLDRITIQKQESSNVYQQRDYKILPPEVQSKEQAAEYWHKLPAILEMPVNSVIVSPEEGDEVEVSSGKGLVIEGYALPEGGDGPVVKVEVSTDSGKTWAEAEIVTEATRWSWVLWRYTYTGQVDEKTVFWSKATDKAGNTQVEGAQWNLRGVAYSAFGELTGLKVKNPSAADAKEGE